MPNQLLNKKMTENVFQISLIAAIYFLPLPILLYLTL